MGKHPVLYNKCRKIHVQVLLQMEQYPSTPLLRLRQSALKLRTMEIVVQIVARRVLGSLRAEE